MPDCGWLLISPFPIAGNWLRVAISRHFCWNAWKQILFKFWAIVGHSVPPPLLQNYFLLGLLITIVVGRDTVLKTLHQSRQEINGKCKCKQTSNEYRQTPPNTQCCILLEIRPLLYILFPTKQKIYIHYQLVYLPNIDSSISTAKLSPPSMYLWHDWNIFSAITSLIKTNIAKSTTDSRVEFCLPK